MGDPSGLSSRTGDTPPRPGAQLRPGWSQREHYLQGCNACIKVKFIICCLHLFNGALQGERTPGERPSVAVFFLGARVMGLTFRLASRART